MAQILDFEARIDQTITKLEESYRRFSESVTSYLHKLNLLKKWLKCQRRKKEQLEQAMQDIRNNLDLSEPENEVGKLQKKSDQLQDLLQGNGIAFDWLIEEVKLTVTATGNRLDEFDEIFYMNLNETHTWHAGCKRGMREGELKHPEGVTVHPVKDLILVANFGNDSIDVFRSDMTFRCRFSEGVKGPNGIHTFRDEIYVSNLHSNCITVHSYAGGKLLRKVGKRGTGDLEFASPEGIAVREHGNSCILYVADRENNRVQVMYRDLKFKTSIGKGHLHEPRDVAEFDKAIYVLDGAYDACVKVFNEAGDKLRQFLTQGTGGEVFRPRYFAIDCSGDLYISDKKGCCITICDGMGVVSKRIGERGEECRQFLMPTGIAINSDGKVVVVDGAKTRNILQIFEDAVFSKLQKRGNIS